MNICALNTLKVGEKAKIRSLDTDSSLYRRLCDIGLVEGTEICCLMKSPLGDPCAYRIRGAVIALRNRDICGIRICR